MLENNNFANMNTGQPRSELRNDSLKSELKNYGQANKPFTRDVEEIDLPPLQKRERTRGILNAISEIQRFHVIESKTELPKDYFALEQTWDFFKIGFKSGLLEGTLFAILVAALQAFYPSAKMYFKNEQITSIEIIILNFLSYSTIALTTLLMLFLSRYYKGVFTKRAIFSLLNGRSFSFFLKAALFFYGFKFIYNYSLSNSENTITILRFINKIFISLFTKISDKQFIDYYYQFIVEKILLMSTELTMIMLVTAIIPYVTIFYKSFQQRLKHYKIEEEYNKY